MDVWMDRQTIGQMEKLMDVWINEQTHKQMDGWTDGRRDE